MRRALPLLLWMLVGGCMHSNLASHWRAEGHAAEKKGSVCGAEQAQYRAVHYARMSGDLGEQGASLYDLGRIKRLLCQDQEAEEYLRKAVEIAEKRAALQDHAKYSLELGRLYHEMGRHSEAVPLLQRGLAEVQKIKGIEDNHAPALADTLEIYSISLGKSDRAQEAAKAAEQAAALRQRKGLSADLGRRRYEMRVCQQAIKACAPAG